jgi:hypothetical protein
MSNPLIEKYFELYPEKKEEPKVIKADEIEGEVTLAQVENAFKKWSSNTSVASNLTTSNAYSVATSNTGITKASNPFATYADDLKSYFLQVAGQLQTGKAQVASINVDIDNHLALKRITFEVMVYEP